MCRCVVESYVLWKKCKKNVYNVKYVARKSSGHLASIIIIIIIYMLENDI